jgi:hypothetical protein
MKKLIFGAFLSTLFVLFSCSESSTPEPETVSGLMTATVNGSAWSSIPGAAIASVIDNSIGGEEVKALQIIGTAPNFSTITISIPIAELSIGSQTFSGEFAEGTAAYINETHTGFYTSQHPSGSFTINITALNLAAGKMSGTFSAQLYDDSDVALNITTGVFTDISIFSTDFYSNGTMSLKRNSGSIFTMDATNEDGKFVTITQSNTNNSISIFGNNTTLTSDFGIYNLNFPKDVAAGTYTLTNTGTYSAGLGNSDSEPEYTVTGGSLTISSHTGNTVTGTFNYTANNGVQTVTISNGSFSITHN